MNLLNIHQAVSIAQEAISFAGTLIILTGIVIALLHYLYYFLSGQLMTQSNKVNLIRLNLGRVLILGLEFIIAADLIATTTTPDYYAVGILGVIVVIRTLLSFSLNRELMALSKEH